MGYDLHITRRKDWSEPGQDIAVEEWLAYVQKDRELLLFPEDGPYFAKWNGKSELPDPWFDWHDGNIYTKNPDTALIDKMVAIARELGAQVQGDDGEIYHSGHEPPIYPKLSFSDRLRNWIRGLRPESGVKPTTPPFKIGDRVLDALLKETTVVEMDPQAENGLGKVKVRYDDGREATFMLAASGLSPLRQEEKENPEAVD